MRSPAWAYLAAAAEEVLRGLLRLGAEAGLPERWLQAWQAAQDACTEALGEAWAVDPLVWERELEPDAGEVEPR